MNIFYAVSTFIYSDDVYAYGQPVDARYSVICPCCPHCGVSLGPDFWLEPRKVILTRSKYGDFVGGNEFLVSERFKEAYEKSGLNGIKQFYPVEVIKVLSLRGDPPTPPKYYLPIIVYSFARVNFRKSVIVGRRDRYCSLCNPKARTKDKMDVR